MSRWSTPRSYRKFKESYVSLEDDPYRQDAVVKASKKQHNKKPLYSSHSGGLYEYTFSSALDQSKQEGKEARELNFDDRFIVTENRDELESWRREDTNSTYNSNERSGESDRLAPYDESIRPWTSQFTPSTDLYSPPRLSRQTVSHEDMFGSFDDTNERNCNYYPTPKHYQQNRVSIPRPKIALAFQYHEIIGPRSLNIHRLRLPSQYLHLLDKIIYGCEDHVSRLPNGWNTDLYSLTKQDIALREAPEVYDLARPIVSYVKKVASIVYGVQQGLKCDKNQPHVLKYALSHKGVELHHDKCDITINLMMSRSNTYVGGGTCFPDACTNVRLEFGEFLLHPGSCVHGGTKILSGTRYLMVIFANAK